MKRLKDFLTYYKPYKLQILLDLFCAFLASAAALAIPLVVRMVTTQALVASREEAGRMLWQAGIFMAFLAVVEYVGNYYISYTGHVTGAKIEFDMRNDLFHHFQKLSFSYYDNAKVGSLMSRITTDLFDVTELAHHGPEDVIISLVKIIGSFIILWQVNIVLTLMVFSILPVMVVFSIYYNKRMRRAFRKNRENIASINAQIEDSLSGIRVVKSFANEELELDKFQEGNTRFVESKRYAYKNMGRFHSGLSFFITLINMVVVLGGGALIVYEVILLPDLITFLLYINLLIEPVRKLINFTEQFQNGAAGFDRFMEIMEESPDIVDDKDAVELRGVQGRVEFRNVSFKYGGTEDYVLQNVNLTAEPGDYVALVGPSGVGKTTLCSLIPRFYEVESGSLRIDGQDIRKAKMKSLRENIGIVQQDVYLFTGTVKDNIRYGKKGATDEEIIQAAKNANAHDFIIRLPQGYDTYIGQRGVKLSGGQKQRLSIARVFLKNPPVLIFDEATSALDNESEKVVQESFDKLAKNRTTFVIAHRLSTVKNAKRILVLTEDGIVEDGSHEALLERKGIYYKLYSMQFQHAPLGGA